MTERLDWTQLGGGGAEIYERHMVPGLFQAWAEDLVALAQVRAGDSVLDAACGTGIVARVAAERVGPAGGVIGVDLSAAMLQAARTAASGSRTEWREASVTALPFADGTFDVVLCQQGLQYVNDRVAALREMQRVLGPGGRLALSVFRRSEGHEDLARAIAPFLGTETAALALEPFRLSDARELMSALSAAGLGQATVRQVSKTTRIVPPEAFLRYFLATRWREAASRLGEAARSAITAAVLAALDRHVRGGALAFPMEAYVVFALAPHPAERATHARAGLARGRSRRSRQRRQT